jgi:hypothetical protein
VPFYFHSDFFGNSLKRRSAVVFCEGFQLRSLDHQPSSLSVRKPLTPLDVAGIIRAEAERVKTESIAGFRSTSFIHVTLSVSEGSLLLKTEILRYTQNDKRMP